MSPIRSSYFLLTLFSASLLSGQAIVSPVDVQASVSLSVDVIREGAILDSANESDFTILNGTTVASVEAPNVLDAQGQALLQQEGFLAARTLVVRDEGNFLRFIASCNADLSYEKLAAIRTDVVEYRGDAELKFDFEVSGGSMPFDLSWDDFWLGSSFELTVVLSRDGDPIPVYEYPAPQGETDPGKRVAALLDPGTYTLEISMPAESLNQDRLRQDLAFELAVGEEPEEIPIPPQGEYTHPDIFTERSGEGILEVIDPTILRETSLGDGRTEIELAVSVANLRAAPWPEVRIGIPEMMEGQPDLEIVALPAVFSLEANETLAPDDPAIVRVADADVPTVRASLLDGSRLRLSGLQQPVFAYPVRPLSPEDLEKAPAFSPLAAAGDLFSLPYVPTTPSGTVWLEWEPFYKEGYRVVIDSEENPPLIARIQGLDRSLPIMIGDVVRVGTDFEILSLDPDAQFPVGGSIALHQFMREGQMLSVMEFEGHPEGLAVTEDPENRYDSNGLSLSGLFPSPVPFHFNQVELSPGILVSGSFGFRPKDLVVNFEMSDFQLKALEVTVRYQADCNLVLETSEGADNSAEPLLGREATLLDLPFMDINLSNGLRFTPRLVLEAGALVSAPTSLSIPVTAGLDVMVMAGVRDGQPVYDSDFTPIPLQVSDPGLYEAFSATALAYLDCEIKAFFSGAGSVFQAGPTLGARAQAVFTFQPLVDPWWTSNAELSLFAGAEFNLANLVTLLDPEQTLSTWALSPLFPQQADGPLAPGPTGRSFNPQPAFSPLGNGTTRWVRSIQSQSAGEPRRRTKATLLSDGSLLASSGDVIYCLSPTGELLWSMDTNAQLMAGAVVAEEDGEFTALGTQSDIRMARFDANGNEIWKKRFSGENGFPWVESIDLAKYDDGNGTSAYFVLGEIINEGAFFSALAKFDGNGDFLWARTFAVPPLADESAGTSLTALTVSTGGDVLLAGTTNADLATVGQLANITPHGVVLKIDGETGDPLWTTLIASGDNPTYSAISEGPNGSIYAGGKAQGSVYSEHPALLLTKLNPDGSLLDSVRIGSAETADTVPHGGESLFDEIFDMTWADDHLWVCGRIGLFNAGAGSIADGDSAFTAMISENLDVSRFVIHAGPSHDSLNSIEATPHGLLVTGISNSFHPWPSGASDQRDVTPGSLLVMMLPWEGRIRFHEGSAGRQLPVTGPEPKSGSYFVTPRVRAASQFTIETNQSLFPAINQDNLTQFGSDARMVETASFDLEENEIFLLRPTFFDPYEYKSLEFVPESLITDLGSYLQYWQLEGGQDPDGDHLTTEMEFYLGTSGRIPDFGIIGFDVVPDPASGDLQAQFTFPRALMAAPALPEVRSGNDLSQFDWRDDVSASFAPLDADRESVTLELPVLSEKEFYKLAFPE